MPEGFRAVLDVSEPPLMDKELRAVVPLFTGVNWYVPTNEGVVKV